MPHLGYSLHKTETTTSYFAFCVVSKQLALRERKQLNRLIDFYLDHEPEFLSDSATESPEEDIAESWTFFVLSEKPYQELLNYREYIR